ncbi:hypothetical protein LguiB_005780 [Lonicera macranthoides]
MAKEAQVAVIVVPFPAQGHLNQLLQLSCLISTHKIPAHFISSATHSRQAKLRATGLNPLDIASIHFHEFPTPHFLSPPANPARCVHQIPCPSSAFFRRFPTYAGACIRTFMRSGGYGPKEVMSGKRKQWAIGPVNPVKINLGISNSRHKCLDWLDKQEPRSVIYVSFGTIVSMTDDEIRELAIGLEKSEQKFLWVLRDADKRDIFEGGVRRYELPEGHEERVGGVGMVVRDWAPHRGTRFLITKILGIGLVMREWEHRGEVVRACSVEESVRSLMVSKEGEDVRKRAEELGTAVRQSKDESGISRLKMDSFIDHITR